MPQMSPMFWEILYFFIIMMMLLLSSKIYYFNQPEFNSNIVKNMKMMNYKNWMW